MKPNWIDLGSLDDLPEGTPVLRKAEGQRFVCVRRGERVDALDDRCPHQGYPLSQGSLRDGVLTCEWHNWKFEIESGACTFGGEPVRRFPSRVEDGRVKLDLAIDTAAEARRLVKGLRTALADDDAARALREGLRLGALRMGPVPSGFGKLYPAFELLARDGAERAEYGFDHGLALLADLTAWIERGLLPAEEAFLVGSHAIAEPSRRLGPRRALRDSGKHDPRTVLTQIADTDSHDPARVSEALIAERREEAETRLRALLEERGLEGARAALTPFVARHLYEYGHGAIFLTKALELAERFPSAAAELLAAATVQLGWATAETALPPFAKTREALATLAASALPEQPAEAFDRAAFEAAVLEGEGPATGATLRLLAAGAAPLALLRAVGHAAATRLARFDVAWEARLDADVGVLDVTHCVTFTEAANSLARRATSREAAQLTLLAAAFVGKLHHADAKALVPPAAGAADLLASVEARDLPGALAAARALDAAGRLEAYRKLAPFVAFDAAVRPIFVAHTVKNTEALRRLEADDPEADGVYLEALLRFVVPRRQENRVRRTAAIAAKFLEDGRPPEGLY
jgi:nitrite reductase/ring-hydroxylating ferredoxin subunit